MFLYNVRQPATFKTFERVPSARLTGQVNTSNAATVFVTVQLQTKWVRNFTYVQAVRTDDGGNFEMTVSYATTNTVGPAEGGTDSAAVATGKNELLAGNAFAPMGRGHTTGPEPAIYDAETITVEFESVEQPTGNETNTNEGNDSSNGTNESALGLPAGSESSASFGAADGLTEDRTPSEASRPRAWLKVYLKGVAMGAADTVPGISGWTIAFIIGTTSG